MKRPERLPVKPRRVSSQPADFKLVTSAEARFLGPKKVPSDAEGHRKRVFKVPSDPVAL
jgi:hypothetical protein